MKKTDQICVCSEHLLLSCSRAACAVAVIVAAEATVAEFGVKTKGLKYRTGSTCGVVASRGLRSRTSPFRGYRVFQRTSPANNEVLETLEQFLRLEPVEGDE